jgi:hypothetical protein
MTDIKEKLKHTSFAARSKSSSATKTEKPIQPIQQKGGNKIEDHSDECTHGKGDNGDGETGDNEGGLNRNPSDLSD